jgi:hypothetical protein
MDRGVVIDDLPSFVRHLSGVRIIFPGWQNYLNKQGSRLPARYTQNFSEVGTKMAAVLVGQFHARDAEGRIYPVHEFKESTPAEGSAPTSTFKLAIGDRVNHLGDDRFQLVQSGVEIVRIP